MGRRHRKSKILNYDAAEAEARRASRKARKEARKNMYGGEYNYGYGGYGYGGYSDAESYGYGSYRGYGSYGGYYGGTYAARTSQAAPKPLTDEEKALLKMMANARSKVYANYEDAMADPNPKVDSFFPSPTGWMVLQRREIDGNKMIFIKKAPKCPLIDEVEQKISLEVVNKIPKECLIEIVGSFARICKLNGNEAAAQIYREKEPAEGSTERRYVVYYPEQQISGAQVTYANDTGMLKMREQHDLVMELHSHNRMSAFWSGTDNANEKDCGFYMVIGTFGAASATYKCRVKYGDLYNDFPAHCIFDMTPEEEAELLKRENWGEGNPIIEERAKAHGSMHASSGYNTGVRTPTLGTSSNRLSSAASGSRGTLPDIYKPRYKAVRGKFVPNTDPVSSLLWKNSVYSYAENAYVCEDHVYVLSNHSIPKGWYPKGSEELQSKNPLLNGVYSKYIAKLEEAYAVDKCTDLNQKRDYTFAASGAAVVDYLLGNAEDIDARRVEVPGRKCEYQGYNTPEYIPGLNDDNFKEAVERQAIARVCAAENIQFAFESNVYANSEPLEEASYDFRKVILERVDAAALDKSFDPHLMWELFTQMEKNRLAQVFGENIVDLARQFHTLDNVQLCYQFLLFIFWATLVPDNYRLKLMEVVETVRNVVEAELTEDNGINIVAAMNAVFITNPDIVIDILRPSNAESATAGLEDEVKVEEVTDAE